MSVPSEVPPPAVVPVCALPPRALADLLEPYGLALEWRAADETIPGSYWGEAEAGLIGHRLLLRPDTPVHSALHEACHFICFMARAGGRSPNPARSPGTDCHWQSADSPAHRTLHTDAGGDDLEECAVCYLQCLLADALPGYSRTRMWRDMDAWGYSFRLGSARAWFERDAEDARQWLAARTLLPGSVANR